MSLKYSDPIKTPSAQEVAKQNTEFAAAHEAGVQFGMNQATAQVLAGTEGQDDGIPFVLIGGQPVSLEQFMPPRMAKQSFTFHDPASLIAYVNKYKQADTAIFAAFTVNGGAFTVIFDFPAPGAVSRKEHRAGFAVQPTPAWAAWLAINSKPQNQDTFCEFVEKWRHLFEDPRAAEMLELARYIEGKKEGQFTFGKRLQTGDREIVWKEETQIRSGTPGGGEATAIPEQVRVLIPLFEGTAPVPLSAWLRVSVNHGAVSFRLELQQVEETVRVALNDVRNTIKNETELPVYLGGISGGAF